MLGLLTARIKEARVVYPLLHLAVLSRGTNAASLVRSRIVYTEVGERDGPDRRCGYFDGQH